MPPITRPSLPPKPQPQVDLKESLVGLPVLCTPQQLAERLQVSTDYLYRLAQRADRGQPGGLESLRFGHKRMFPRTAVAAWLEACRASAGVVAESERAQAVVREELERLRPFSR